MGTRKHTLTLVNGNKDHPHAYGDKTWTANTIFGIVGSSPRVWGQELSLGMEYMAIRIIPTRMGTRHRLTIP